MIFFFKKPKLVVECFTTLDRLQKVGIPKANNFIPDWWKTVDKSLWKSSKHSDMAVPYPTMKTCPGFTDLYKRGNILPLWTELLIESDHFGYKWEFAGNNKNINIERHSPDQYASKEYTEDFKSLHHVKLNSPWIFKCKKDTPFLAIEPVYNNLLSTYGIKYLPGVLNFKDQHGTNVNFFIPANINSIKMFYMDPLYHFICLDNDVNVEFKSILISQNEHDDLSRNMGFRTSFLNDYKKSSKCPFS
jgi:hypothetical protein